MLTLVPQTAEELRIRGYVYHVRFADLRDAASIISNIEGVIAEGSFLITQHFVFTEDWNACFISGLDQINRRALAVVATEEGKVIGHCRLFPVWGGDCTAHVGDIGFVVLKDHRNIGLGSALISYILSCATELGYQKITLCTASKNIPALHLATKFGFVEEGRRTRQYFIRGEYVDEILMARFLDDPGEAWEKAPVRQL